MKCFQKPLRQSRNRPCQLSISTADSRRSRNAFSIAVVEENGSSFLVVIWLLFAICLRSLFPCDRRTPSSGEERVGVLTPLFKGGCNFLCL